LVKSLFKKEVYNPPALHKLIKYSFSFWWKTGDGGAGRRVDVGQRARAPGDVGQ
jgi:hypothetical protein